MSSGDATKATSAKSVEEMFRPHHDEIQRRRKLKEERVVKPATNFAKSSHTAPTTYDIDDQNIVLFSVSHTKMPPIALHGKGSVRIYGIFADVEDARAHAEEVAKVDANVSLLMAKAREWISVMHSMPRASSADDMEEVRERLLGEHEERLKTWDREFKQQLAKAQSIDDGARATANDDVKLEYDSEDDGDAAANGEGDLVNRPLPKDGKKARRTLPTSAQVAGQKVAVLSVIYDAEEPNGEFLVRVYACFETVQEADAWIRNVAAPKVQQFSLDVVTTCQWICPARMALAETPPQEVYREEELNNIMQFRKAEPERVTEYKQWRKATDAETKDDTSERAEAGSSDVDASCSAVEID